MSKKDKAIYAPGELSRVREKLGVFDQKEAEELVRKLGGQVGYEREESSEQSRQPLKRDKTNSGGRIGSVPPRNRERQGSDPDETEKNGKEKRQRKTKQDTQDDPSVPIRVTYFDRIKMDRFAGQSEFDIKSPPQVLFSIFSPFSDIPDYVSPAFVNRRMPEYYRRLEVLVLSTRTLFPRNNFQRNERMKKGAPLVHSILDVIRGWDIEKISADLAKIQAQGKNVTVSDFMAILKAFYRPLFFLERLDFDIHIRGAYKILYKLLYIENPTEAESNFQELIRTSLSALSGIRQNIRHLLYPLLMKTVSANYVHYEYFFAERKNRIMAFLDVTEDDRINPEAIVAYEEPKETKPEDESSGAGNSKGQSSGGRANTGNPGKAETAEAEISEEEKLRISAEDASKKALDRGLRTLEALFPQAGWERLSAFPDLYPYFVGVFEMPKGAVNIAPTDPLQQTLVLMYILEELFFAVRHISFDAIPDASGDKEDLNISIGGIISNWRYYIETSLGKDYLPKLAEHVRILEGSREERTSMYSKKIVTELQWLKRLYFLPFYKFESLLPPPFRKGEISPVYTEIKKLRKYFSIAAAGIEQGSRAGGAERQAPCPGINNPWTPYVFEVPNPVSMRMDTLLAPKKRDNATLIYFSLAITTVLDHLINNEKSWAYAPQPNYLFRSVNGEGIIPLTGVDYRIDADAIFKQAIKQLDRK